MLRTSVCTMVALLILAVGLVRAEDAKKPQHNQKAIKATITNVNPEKGTITVRMKDKSGKNVTKTFTLMEDAEYVDSTGNVAELDVFRSGDQVLYVEREGKIQHLKKRKMHGIL